MTKSMDEAILFDFSRALTTWPTSSKDMVETPLCLFWIYSYEYISRQHIFRTAVYLEEKHEEM
jgi:hypothetical protein